MSGVFLLTLTAILSIVYFFKHPRVFPVRAEVARELIRTGATVIDVRTDEEWNTGHYPHAFHVPQITTLTQVVPERDTTLLLYCRTGRRAFLAAQAATGLGYKSVYYLVDGSYEDLEEHLRLQ